MTLFKSLKMPTPWLPDSLDFAYCRTKQHTLTQGVLFMKMALMAIFFLIGSYAFANLDCPVIGKIYFTGETLESDLEGTAVAYFLSMKEESTVYNGGKLGRIEIPNNVPE